MEIKKINPAGYDQLDIATAINLLIDAVASLESNQKKGESNEEKVNSIISVKPVSKRK